MDVDDRLIFAAASVLIGLAVGAVCGLVVRRSLSRQDRREALQSIAVPASIFVFWLATATGILFALGATSPDSLRPIPRLILEWIPNVLIAGLLVLGGYAAAIAVSTTVGGALTRATAQSHNAAERSIRWTIIGGALVLALSQLGVRTTIILVLIAGVVSCAALTFALLAGLGGKDVASHIAASRTLRSELLPGSHIAAGDVAGTIVDLNATTLAVQTADDRRVLIPYGQLLAAPFEVAPPTIQAP